MTKDHGFIAMIFCDKKCGSVWIAFICDGQIVFKWQNLTLNTWYLDYMYAFEDLPYFWNSLFTSYKQFY